MQHSENANAVLSGNASFKSLLVTAPSLSWSLEASVGTVGWWSPSQVFTLVYAAECGHLLTVTQEVGLARLLQLSVSTSCHQEVRLSFTALPRVLSTSLTGSSLGTSITFRSRIIQRALSHLGFVGVCQLLIWAAHGFRTGTWSQTSVSGVGGGLGSGPPVSEAPGCGRESCRLSYTRFGESYFWGMENPETQPV